VFNRASVDSKMLSRHENCIHKNTSFTVHLYVCCRAVAVSQWLVSVCAWQVAGIVTSKELRGLRALYLAADVNSAGLQQRFGLRGRDAFA